jgi:putative PEP-CTERM system TPR-repeat lipoprotein
MRGRRDGCPCARSTRLYTIPIVPSAKSAFRRPWQCAALALLLSLACAVRAAGDPRAARYYENALERYQAKDISGAIIQLKNALQIDRSLLPVHLLLGRALLENGEFAGAEVEFEESLRLGVSRAEAVIPLARSVMGQGRPRELLSQPRFAPEQLPANVRSELLLIRAAAASDLGDHKAAMLEIQAARDIVGDRLETWLAEVPIRTRAGQFAQAAQAAQRAVALAPASPEAHYLLGSVHHAQGQIAPALKAYDKALGLEAGHREALIARAGLHIDLKRFDAAQKDIAAVRGTAPKEPRAAYLAALLSERQGDSAGSRAALAEVTTLLDPVPPDFLRYRPQLLMLGGLAHYGLGQIEKAASYLERAQQVQGNVAASKLLAKIYIAQGNTDRAVNLLQTYIDANPRDVPAVELMAQAHMSANRASRAVHLLRRTLRKIEAPSLRASLGVALVAADKPDEAIPELEAAWRADSTQTRAAAALVSLYAQRSEHDRAQRLAETLVQREPGNPGFHALVGTARLQAGRLDAARKAYEQAARLAPGSASPQLSLARLEMASGQFDAANARLEALLKIDARDVAALFEMALLAERRGRRDQARQWFQKAVDHSTGTDRRAVLALIEFHLRGHDLAEALKLAHRLSADAPEDLAVLLATSRVLLANGDHDGARTLLTRATRIAEYEAAAQIEIAILQLAAGHAPGAAYSLEKALSSEPDNLRANAVLVDVLLRQRDLDTAQRVAGEIATRHPNRAIGASLQGDVAAARGQMSAALGFYQKAHRIEPSSDTLLRLMSATAASNPAAANQLAEEWIKRHPRDARVIRELANGHARAGRFARARSAYEALLTLAPRDRDGLNNLANVLMRLGDPGALAAAERALAAYPADADIIDTAAWAAYLAGQKDRALQMLRDARLRAPENPEIRYHLAKVLADSGRGAEARRELEPVLRDDRRFESRTAAQALFDALN